MSIPGRCIRVNHGLLRSTQSPLCGQKLPDTISENRLRNTPGRDISIAGKDGGSREDCGFNESVSFAVQCETQGEIDHYWEKLAEGGDPKAQQCGWLKDRYGLSWQVVPALLPGMLQDPDRDKVERVTNALVKTTGKLMDETKDQERVTLNQDRENGIIDGEGIDVWNDELTPCLRDGKTGEIVKTEHKAVNSLAQINKISKEYVWEFDWVKEWNRREKNSEFYKLTVKGIAQTQGIIHIIPKEGFVEAQTMESAPHNREEIVGEENRKYKGVGGHLVAIAVERSIEEGSNGCVGFTSITKRVEQYKKMLHARVVGPAPSGAVRMEITEENAAKLHNKYFGDVE